ncbi:flippase-like domain-containing protein [Actinomadura sp. PM05-2]|uniref:Flippase-like domain-containing protein n=2 Tax=Actinomadura parmotrematis TaxID=2864039 RepID=A0ABS7FTQ1_9ACTN|nr:flippase-like domain-containing protein [Actinomadura parmotrematis]
MAAPAHASAAPDTGEDTGAPMERPGRRSGRRTLLVQWGLVLLGLATLPFLSDQLPDLGEIWSAARGADPGWLLVVVLAEAGSMGAFARLQRRLLKVGGLRVGMRRMFAITYAGNALSTTLPAGPAVSVVFTFQQFRRSGASARLATAVIILGGVITTTAYTAIGLLALLADPTARGLAGAALAVPAALVPLAVLALARPRSRALLARAVRRPVAAIARHRRIEPWARRLRDGLKALRPTRRDWTVLALLAVANWTADILALFAAARAVGIEVAPTGVTLAYFAAQAAGSLLPLLPGGIGAIESSMAASLVAFGATLAPAGAAVGLYRLVSYWIVVGVGWLAWLALQEGPRLSARTRARLAGTGRALLAGFGAYGLCGAYGSAGAGVPVPAPAEPPAS